MGFAVSKGVIRSRCSNEERIRWHSPRSSSKRQTMLQAHDERLELQAQELLQLQSRLQHALYYEDVVAVEGKCNRILADFRFHFRLEERWLARFHCLDLAHSVAHQEALHSFTQSFLASSGGRSQLEQWLQDLQFWLCSHRKEHDINAYALAASYS